MSSSTTTRGKSDGFSLESLSIYYQHILKERPCSLDLRPRRRILLVGGPGDEHTSTLQNRQTKLNTYPNYQLLTNNLPYKLKCTVLTLSS